MEPVRFALLGIGVGAVYALLAQGLVVVYRACGVVNFAHGALAMLGAFTYDELVRGQGWAQAPAVVTAVVAVAALSAVIHLAIMRPLRTASPLARVIATLGLLIIIQSAASLMWGASPRTVRGFLPRTPVRLDSVTIASDRLWLLGIAVLLTGALTRLPTPHPTQPRPEGVLFMSTMMAAPIGDDLNATGPAGPGMSCPDALGTVARIQPSILTTP